MTYDQTFIWLLKTDTFFKQECKFIRQEWLSDRSQKKQFESVKESGIGRLNIGYRQDIGFIMQQSQLPERFFWPLHMFLLKNKIPAIRDLPPRARATMSFDSRFGIGKLLIEADYDAGKEDILKAFSSAKKMKQVLQRLHRAKKISQPTYNFETLLKIAASPETIDEAVLDDEDIWVDGNHEATKKKVTRRLNTTRSRISRSNKKLVSNRVSVRDRERLEKCMDDLSFQEGNDHTQA